MSPAALSILDRAGMIVLLGLAASELAHLVLGLSWAAGTTRVMALGLLVVSLPRFKALEWALLTLALCLAAALWWRGDVAGITGALTKSAYFAAFILLLMLLREAAATSASVLSVGAWISQQPPGRRFVVTWLGGHTAGILMNFGAVSLLAPLIQRGVRAGPMETAEDQRRALIRERRQLSSLIRGFAWVIVWSPTMLTQVIILAGVPGVDPFQTILWGLGLSAIMFLVGWGEDRLRWGKPRMAPGEGAPFPGRALAELSLVYVFLVGGAVALVLGLGLALPEALMTVAPVILIGWVVCQVRAGTLPSIPKRLAEIASVSIPAMGMSAYIFGTAGFIGITAGQLAPVDTIAQWTETAQIPGWVWVAALPALITLGGQVALSPMMMVTFLAAVLSGLPELPADPQYIALALAAGWALSMTSAPNATGALLIAGATGIPSTTLTWRWNGVYSLSVLCLLAVLAWAIVGSG
ncbi:MAG: hypothetical protein AAF674_09035 [Pseudomonadota bacterium]